MDQPDCILHTGAVSDGYGVKKYKRKIVRAHRLAFCVANNLELDSIKEFVVMHSCDNRLCINPAHLSLGSHADNCADKVLKGRQARGERSGNAKLKDLEVIQIKRKLLRGVSISSLAIDFGVSSMCISRIRSGKTWSHLSADRVE